MTATGFLLFVEPVFAQFETPELRCRRLPVPGPLEHHDRVAAADAADRRAARIDRRTACSSARSWSSSCSPRREALFLEEEGNFLLDHRRPRDSPTAIEAVRATIVSVALVAIAVVIIAPLARGVAPAAAGAAAERRGHRVAAARSRSRSTRRRSGCAGSRCSRCWPIPAGFLAGLLSSRLARGGLADLFLRLPTMRGEELQPALARALGDPSVEIVRGRPARSRRGGRWRRSTTSAALVYDASLDDDPELIEAVASAAGIALESRARLERIVTAGDDERRRLERNLHDGAQQRLVALAMQLRLIQHELHSDPAAADRLVDNASEELAMSLAELRELARGIHPAVLNHGLEPALQTLAGQATVPTEVAYAAEGRLPEPVELAAYFVTSEALANVGKYARATSAKIRVVHDDGRARGGDRRRRRRRRRRVARLGPARPRRPRRGARRPAAGATARPGRGPSCARSCHAGRDRRRQPARARGHRLAAAARRRRGRGGGRRRRRSSCALVDEHEPDAVDRRRADAADPHRGGPRGGARDPRAPSARSGS